MATYTLISSNVLTASAASVTFSSIPATYTDLVLRWSARQDFAAVSTGGRVEVNGSVSAVFSETTLSGNGATASSSNATGNTGITQNSPGSSATSDTFGSNELYFPNYTNSTANKPMSLITVVETNATTAFINARAGLRSNTAAITEIKINAGFNFVSGSSFYLYGISNA
jgi:hypothetical protein